MSRPLGLLALTALAVALAGCETKNPHVTGADVTGTVTHKGAPLPGGTIRLALAADESKSGTGEIKGDGTFSVANAPVGEVKVVVDTSSAKMDPRAFMGKVPADVKAKAEAELGPPKKFTKLEPKYSSFKDTPLRLTIGDGKQTHAVEVP